MSRDYAEMERAFIAALEADTGRDLAAWMGAIDALGPLGRNDIIDWLRRQRFTFARASWIERIHHNGGRPIYEGEAKEAAAARPAPRRRAAVHRSDADAAAPAAPAAPPSPGDAALIESLAARAKGYRPLFHLLTRSLARAVPGLALVPEADHVSLRAPAEFGAIEVTAKGLRLALALGEEEGSAGLEPVRLRRPAGALTHQVALDDARQVTPALLALAATAARRVAG
jgi:hypothetical protein